MRTLRCAEGQKLLFSDASATLQPGQKIALIGGNGCGKSSLFALLLDELQADAGDIRGLKGLRISHMAQETDTSDLTARDYVIAGDAALYQVLQDLATADAAGEYRAIGHVASAHGRARRLQRRAPRGAAVVGAGVSARKNGCPDVEFFGGLAHSTEFGPGADGAFGSDAAR